MKSLIAAIVMSLVGLSAMADTYVPYGRWVPLNYCGGETKLDCPSMRGAKESDQCTIQFRGSYVCERVKLYVGSDYYPTYYTSDVRMKGSFYVDYSKINIWGRDSFKIYMYSTDSEKYEQVHYQFNY